MEREYAERMLRHYAEATPETREAGREWYRRAQREARRMAREHGTRVSTAAGVIAALSPNVAWAVNVRGAERVLAGEATGIAGFGVNVGKARAIAAGARPLDVLRGPKVTRFYRAIMGAPDAAVVDMWMIRSAGEDENACPKARVDAIRRSLDIAAAVVGERVTDFQAIVWTHVRGSAE